MGATTRAIAELAERALCYLLLCAFFVLLFLWPAVIFGYMLLMAMGGGQVSGWPLVLLSLAWLAIFAGLVLAARQTSNFVPARLAKMAALSTFIACAYLSQFAAGIS
ncbi:putative RDD family membrane protein YckC [Sphingobium xanthum]|jgi:uncharacterized RDD family membrane protein YckC|uniref:hypothetical protein n=1 Tax=Sphingobium xanthum TaxID=1387165 RepID=UPI001C8B1DC5|nr:hypothetical protein [Sphingobium xanthum]